MADSPIDVEIRSLHERHRQAKARLKRLVQVSRILSIVLFLVLVGFLAGLYNKATAMYAPENFEGPLQEEAANLLPKLEPEIRTLWQETAPVYGEIALEKFELALPVLQESAGRELAALSANLTMSAEDRVSDALTRISRRHQARLAEMFPRLSSVEGAEELGTRWMENIQGDLEQVVLHFHDRYSEDLGELAVTLDQFRPNDLEQMSEEELTREFIHLWLIKADRWVMQDDLRDGGNDHED